MKYLCQILKLRNYSICWCTLTKSVEKIWICLALCACMCVPVNRLLLQTDRTPLLPSETAKSRAGGQVTSSARCKHPRSGLHDVPYTECNNVGLRTWTRGRAPVQCPLQLHCATLAWHVHLCLWLRARSLTHIHGIHTDIYAHVYTLYPHHQQH